MFVQESGDCRRGRGRSCGGALDALEVAGRPTVAPEVWELVGGVVQPVDGQPVEAVEDEERTRGVVGELGAASGAAGLRGVGVFPADSYDVADADGVVEVDERFARGSGWPFKTRVMSASAELG